MAGDRVRAASAALSRRAATRSIGLATGVRLLPEHNPALLAK